MGPASERLMRRGVIFDCLAFSESCPGVFTVAASCDQRLPAMGHGDNALKFTDFPLPPSGPRLLSL